MAYSDAGAGVSVATNDGENGWVSFTVGPDGGLGLAGTATADGIALSYYAGDQVVVATGAATGPFDVSPAVSVAADSGTAPGAGTSIAADEQGTLWLGWADSALGVGLASGDGSQFSPKDTGSDTQDGSMPSVSVKADGSTAYLAWYDTENEDLLVGAYGDLEGLAIAAPSPEPTGPPPTEAPSGSENCTEAVDGVVDITAQAIAFDADLRERPRRPADHDPVRQPGPEHAAQRPAVPERGRGLDRRRPHPERRHHGPGHGRVPGPGARRRQRTTSSATSIRR